MPLPGEQHRDTPATTNPFVEQKPHVSEYTAQQVATLQSRLDKQLGPEYISTRPGAGGGKVHYLAAEKVINLANEVFGFNGWSSAIQNVQIDFVDESATGGKITLGLSTIVRVTLRDGAFHEDIGYGHIENCKGKAAAFEKAKKEAVTDALKRALRNFGNVLGNCLYDKDYLQKVTKLKVAPSKWDAENLHRHPDFAPIKRESIADVDRAQPGKGEPSRRQSSAQSGSEFGSMDLEDEFGGSLLDDSDFTNPDEVRLDETVKLETPATRAINGQQRQGVPRMHSMPQLRPPNLQQPPSVQNPQPPQRVPGVQRPGNTGPQTLQSNHMPPAQIQTNQQHPAQATPAPTSAPLSNLGVNLNFQSATATNTHSPNIQQNPSRPQPSSGASVMDFGANGINGDQSTEQGFQSGPRVPPPGNPEGFVTGRSADMLNQGPSARPPNAALAFNPHHDSPSIRRTHGFNHGKSAPVTRQSAVAASQQQVLPQTPAAPTARQSPQPPSVPHQAASGGNNSTNGFAAPTRANFVNPSADPSRRVGMPQPMSNGMQNRGGYRPPTAAKRPPLSDVSNLQSTQMDGAGEVKRAKLDPEAPGVVQVSAEGEVAPAAQTGA